MKLPALVLLATAFALAAHAQGPTEARPLLMGDWPDVTLSYRDTNGGWRALTPGYAIDRMGDSLSGVRAALFAPGTGSVRIHHFHHQPFKP
jgi:hypothetical protein